MNVQSDPHIGVGCTRSGLNHQQQNLGRAAEVNPAFLRTVGDWRAAGHYGLRIPRCPACGRTTRSSWADLEADLTEDIVSVAFRMRCSQCGKPPDGLAITAYTELNIDDDLNLEGSSMRISE